MININNNCVLHPTFVNKKWQVKFLRNCRSSQSLELFWGGGGGAITNCFAGTATLNCSQLMRKAVFFAQIKLPWPDLIRTK